MKLNHFLKVEIEVTPEILAKAFWDMSAQDQALFFEELASIAPVGDFVIQMCNVSDFTNDAAKYLMKTIGDYSK